MAERRARGSNFGVLAEDRKNPRALAPPSFRDHAPSAPNEVLKHGHDAARPFGRSIEPCEIGLATENAFPLQPVKDEVTAMVRQASAEYAHIEEARDAHALRRVLSREPMEIVRLLSRVDIAPDSQEANTHGHADTPVCPAASFEPAPSSERRVRTLPLPAAANAQG